MEQLMTTVASFALDGWDSPALKHVLEGTITEHGAWKGEPPLLHPFFKMMLLFQICQIGWYG
jgi:hypothetical protein